MFLSEEIFDESNLSRIYQHLQNRDCAILTAFRSNPFDRTLCAAGYELSFPEDVGVLKTNKLNNRDLKASLLSVGCGLTNVDGSFIENYKTSKAVEVKEDSVFAVNLKDSPDFFDIVIKLGKRYCQDAVLLIPKGGKEVLSYGTNNFETPGLDNKVKIGDWKGGKESEFMTKIRNRPFVFETYEDCSRIARMTIKAIAKTILKD